MRRWRSEKVATRRRRKNSLRRDRVKVMIVHSKLNRELGLHKIGTSLKPEKEQLILPLKRLYNQTRLKKSQSNLPRLRKKAAVTKMN